MMISRRKVWAPSNIQRADQELGTVKQNIHCQQRPHGKLSN